MEATTMDENDSTTTWEARPDGEKNQIANMDEIDFMTLLMESRIIQAS
jgi:hypothetical protein